MIFAALFFEYVEIKPTLAKFREMMHDSSVLLSIIQLPGEDQSKVSKSKYKSLEALAPYITLTTAEEFVRELSDADMRIILSTKKTLANGKTFFLTESVKK